ncbi:MAG: hypothetical protein PWR32_311 [Candidatus Woesearchaeota archaeon]|nr:hypothetical protein [Candidatus Woesearchaeota archaeon]
MVNANTAMQQSQATGRMANKHKTSTKNRKNSNDIYFKIAFVLIAAFIFLVFLIKPNTKSNSEENQTTEFKEVIRKSAISGSWYPGTKEVIIKTIDNFFNNNKQDNEVNSKIKQLQQQKILAIIVPHAGWQFSGQVASTAFNAICNKSYHKVFIIAPSHYVSFKGVSVANFTHYETPLGKVKVSNITYDLLKEPLFKYIPEAHSREHAIEIELPSLQRCLQNFEIIPILVGNLNNYSDLENIANTLNKYIDDNSLIVVSSDFTHYGLRYGFVPFTNNISENLKSLDMAAFNNIKSLDPKKFYKFIQESKDTICGRYPILILMNLLKDKKLNITLIKYDTSGNITKDFTNSVSYMAIAFSNPEDKIIELNKSEKEFLLTLARSTIETYLKTGRKPKIDENSIPNKFKQKMGCFVTLEKNHNLRGCIGHILPQEELYKCVIDNAINAAVKDPRFNPVTLDELDDISIEISVLSVPQKLEFSSPEDLKNKLIPNVHGVILKRGFYQSTFLPQVWEKLSDKEEFLTHLCLKAGMEPLCWTNPNTEVYVYRAYVFCEEDL